MNWKAWLKGLGAAAISGAAMGATQAVSGGVVNKGTGVTAGVGSIAGALLYLMKSPIQAGGSQIQVVVTPKQEEPKPEAK